MKTLVFDFKEIGEKSDKATRKALQLFARAGLEVVSASVDPKSKRSSSISYRDVNFVFADSQYFIGPICR